jgi:hypothetical protein
VNEERWVVGHPPILKQKIDEIYKTSNIVWGSQEYAKEEALSEKQYKLIREAEENELPKGQRFHKGPCLNGWGIAMLNQRDPKKVKEGYRKLALAHIEDLLDYPELPDRAEAHLMLKCNPLIKKDLLDDLYRKVKTLKAYGEVPKNPEEVLSEYMIFSEEDFVRVVFNRFTQRISKKVFIVHGKDGEMKQEVARFIDSIGLEPVILSEQLDKGKTIIEKFLQYSDLGYAVILLSPDDFAYSKGLPPENAKSRARQNVILELGYFIGKLGRENIMALYRENANFEMPSDFSGELYTIFDPYQGWQIKLAKELSASGYPVKNIYDNT